MSISSISGSPSQLFAAQQALAASATSLDTTPDDSVDDLTDLTTDAASSSANNLTGSTTASLDSQTLQALMGLTQQDPTSTESQTGQSPLLWIPLTPQMHRWKAHCCHYNR